MQKGFAILALILVSSLVGTLFMLGGEEVVREMHSQPVHPQIYQRDVNVATPVPQQTPFRSTETWK